MGCGAAAQLCSAKSQSVLSLETFFVKLLESLPGKKLAGGVCLKSESQEARSFTDRMLTKQVLLL